MADMRWQGAQRRDLPVSRAASARALSIGWLKAARTGKRHDATATQQAALGVFATSRAEIPASKRPKG
jgi:hypothetical protein